MIFQRLRRLWALSKKDPEVVEKMLKLEPEDIAKLPDPPDGKAVFMSEGTQEEFEELQKEDSGMAAWYKRIKNL